MTSRRDLGRIPGFTRVSPRLGELDPEALEALLEEDLDAGLVLLAELTGAVDSELASMARRIAGEIILRIGSERPRAPFMGFSGLAPAPAGPEGDIDFDSSLDAVVRAAATGRIPAVDELVSRRWSGPDRSVALVVDRSGSMGGARLSTAALAASALAHRAPRRYAVLAFAGDVTVIKGSDEDRTPAEVVDDLLALRGHGSTDLALALVAAHRELGGYESQLREATGRSGPTGAVGRSARSLVVLLSDCRHNGSGDPEREALWPEHLAVVAPAGDAGEARAFAFKVGGSCAEVSGPSDLVGALNGLLG